MSNASSPQLPLFYSGAVPLSSSVHGAWCLSPSDAAFAAEASAAPVTATEFAAASRFYPIVFTAQTASPVVLMGLEKSNLFVAGGKWAEGTYIPAYVRRYPFLLIEMPGKGGYMLGIDSSSAQVIKDGSQGKPLFEKNEPSDITKMALEFCRQFNQDHLQTQGFCRALEEADILVDRRADAALPDGRRMGVQGFKVVDTEKFMALDETRVFDWHKRGWLALVHYHLASLERFSDLLNRQGLRADVTQSTSGPGSNGHDDALVKN